MFLQWGISTNKTSFLVVQLVWLVGQECAFLKVVHVSLYSSAVPGVFC